MEGLNISITIIRRDAGSKDAVGGITYSGVTIGTARARISSIGSGMSLQLKQQGFEVTRMKEIAAIPSNLDVKEDDTVAITGGLEDGNTFVVRFVKRDSLPTTDGRAHVELFAERIAYGRVQP